VLTVPLQVLATLVIILLYFSIIDVSVKYLSGMLISVDKP